jgi:hypothetical protein
VQVTPQDAHIQYQGRVGMRQSGPAEIYWPGSSVALRFKGTGLQAVLRDERGYNHFNIIIDDSLVRTIRIDTVKRSYTLAADLSDKEHTIELSKRADWFRGKTWFYGFEATAGTRLRRLPAKKRMIEFYGNSITVGAAVEDFHGDSGDSTYTNNYRSYASITARHFNAGYSCIASSGIGLMVSWGSLIMPDIWDLLDPADSTSKWSFAGKQPDVVVVNLLQNDYALFGLPDHPQFKKRFGKQAPGKDSVVRVYAGFVSRIRQHYPGAWIVCALGPMDAVSPGSPWPGYIEEAVASLHDEKILTHFFPYLNKPGHPKIADQQQMADALIDLIRRRVGW